MSVDLHTPDRRCSFYISRTAPPYTKRAHRHFAESVAAHRERRATGVQGNWKHWRLRRYPLRTKETEVPLPTNTHRGNKITRADHPDLRSRNGDLFNRVDLRRVNLDGIDWNHKSLFQLTVVASSLRDANFSHADLTGANLSWSALQGANFRGARLVDADLRGCLLLGCDFTGAVLNNVTLNGANLSGATGLPTARALLEGLEKTAEGFIAYKAIGKTDYAAPGGWVIEAGAVLTEVVNPDPTQSCGCGVNVGTKWWVENIYPLDEWQQGQRAHWKVLIEWADLADAVVPYGSPGKFRVSRATLIEKVDL